MKTEAAKVKCKVLFIGDNGNWSWLLSGCIHYLRGAFNPSLTSHLRLLMRGWPRPLLLVFLLLHLPFLWGRRRSPADVISPRQVPFLPFSTSARIHTNPISSHLEDISHVWKRFCFFFPRQPNTLTVTTLCPYLLTLQVLAGVIGSQYPLAATSFKPSLLLYFALLTIYLVSGHRKKKPWKTSQTDVCSALKVL